MSEQNQYEVTLEFAEAGDGAAGIHQVVQADSVVDALQAVIDNAGVSERVLSNISIQKL